MSNVSSVLKYFATANEGFSTTLGSTISSGATTIPLGGTAGLTDASVFVGIIEPGAAAQQVFTGLVSVSGSSIINVVWTRGSNTSHTAGVTIVDYPTGTQTNMQNTGILKHANQDGSLIGSAVRTALGETASSGAGYTTLGSAPNTVVYNGNRSYTLTFNAVDLTPTLSPGMRLAMIRSNPAPTQSTLLNGTTQYYSKTAPAGMTATDNITVMGWIKPTSYASGGLAARQNGTTDGWYCFMTSTGQLQIGGARAGDDVYATYHSVPLNKWTHVAITINSSGAVGTAYFDGALVPGAFTNNVNVGFLTPTQSLTVGATNGASPTNFFPGKIAQVAIFSSVLSQATIQSYASQGLAGTETSLISAYSFNNSINDLNANANNLTANGSAVATNNDTPFTQTSGLTGLTAGTTNYGIIQNISFSTNTTVVVQVPEGDTIPTSGGVSAVSYSTQKVPYGFPVDVGKWEVGMLVGIIIVSTTTTASVITPFQGVNLNVPIGSWDLILDSEFSFTNTSTTADSYVALSTSTSAFSDFDFVHRQFSQNYAANPIIIFRSRMNKPTVLTTATPYYPLALAGNTVSNISLRGVIATSTGAEFSKIIARNAYL